MRSPACAIAIWLGGCGLLLEPKNDAADASVPDAELEDATIDARLRDATVADAVVRDSSPDVEARDANVPDASVLDASVPDVNVLDTSVPDVGIPCLSSDECTAGPCRTAVCTLGMCLFTSLPNGTPCDDRNACSLGDACEGGHCTPTSYTSCGGPNECIASTCDPLDGICATFPRTPGSPCDHGECQGGRCQCELGYVYCDSLERCVGNCLGCCPPATSPMM